jgi:tetratricopeptide (TPR) repeat protein
MRPFLTRPFLASACVLALAALPASAANIKLKNGTVVSCKVTAYDPATKTLSVQLEDGRDVQYGMDQLEARSVYLVNASLIPKKDAQAQLLAANFARDAGLYAHAARHYQQAEKLDPALKSAIEPEMASLRRTAAAMCAEKARAAVAKKDYKEAEKWAKVLIEKLPNEPEAAQAATALEEYYEKTRAAKMAAAEAKASEALKKDVVQGKKRFEKMAENTKKGLQARGSTQAKGFFNQALADGKFVLKELDRLEDKYEDSATQERAQEYRKIVTDQMVDVHLSIASLEATQSDYKGAQRAVNEALALDPKNEAALSMRARIEDYASRGIGWGLW